MADISQVTPEAAAGPEAGGTPAPAPGSILDPTPAPPGPPTGRRTPFAGLRLRLPNIPTAAALAALVAILCALALPFAPVLVNEPTVSWPRDPARPTSTLLQLTAYRPLTLDIRFSCDVARAARTSDGVVISTAQPDDPVAGSIGLIAVVRGDRMEIRGFGRLLVDETMPSGPCSYRITGSSHGVPSFARPPDPNHPILPDLAQFANQNNAHLTITRDGRTLADTGAQQLPDVDMLATSVPQLPAELAGELSVTMRVNDEFTSSPTPLKSALTWLLVAALLATLVLVALMDRGTPRVSTRFRLGFPRLVDAVVPAVILYWMYLAPATDDDGYYAAMAHNAEITGRVGNYYQLYDQNFTPFTWFYQSLGWWQQIVGTSPVAQRIPAAVLGILTWLVLRRFVIAAMHEWAPDRRGTRMVAHAVLAACYLSWWVALDMGVRPETAVAACAATTMLAVLAAHRRRRLVFAWFAVAIAGLGFVTHPTGFTLFAPLLAGLPLLWPVLRVPGKALVTAARVLAVGSAGMVAPLVAFANGSLRDFLRGQALFLSIQGQEDWTSEYQRYYFLLAPIPMGNFAKRAAVLACILALLWFALLAVAARMRGVTLPTPLWFAGVTTALAFGLLWLTPSKWSHHFGALAGVGSTFLALLLVTAVALLRAALAAGSDRPKRPAVGVVAAAVVSVVVVAALAWHGPNDWPYAWMAGIPRPYLPPMFLDIPLDAPWVWLGVFALATIVIVLVSRLRDGWDLRLGALRAAPVVLVFSLAATCALTVLTFGTAAANQTPPEAVWSDPTGAHCTAAGVVRVLDPTSARTLQPASGLPPSATAPEGFVAGGGYFAGNRPQGGAASTVWGSLVAVDGRTAEATTGQMSTGWYTLRSGLGDSAGVTVLAAGTLSEGNTLTAVYGSRVGPGGSVVPLGTQALTDSAQEPSWRTFTLSPPAGADVVRLAAVDGTQGVDGWLAFTAPALATAVPLSTYLPPEAPVALAWQLAFAYPCQRQPAVHDGITESPRYAVLYGDPDKPLSGFGDGTWQAFRGGVFAQVPRSQSVQQLAVAHGVDPHVQVYAFATTLRRDAYWVTTQQRTVGGADPTTGTGP